jgi:YD repeat-containing protein
MKRSSYAMISVALLLITTLLLSPAAAITELEENRSVAIEGAVAINALLVQEDGGLIAAGASETGPVLWFIGSDGEITGNVTVGAGNATTLRYIDRAPDGTLLLFTDVFELVKADPAGTVLWSWHVPYGEVSGLDTAAGGAYIASNYLHPMIYRAGPEGTEEWNRTYADGSGVGYARLTTIRTLPGGGFAAAGYVQPLAEGTDPTGLLLFGNADGSTTGEVRYGHESIGYLTSLHLHPDGGFLATALGTDGVTPSLLRLSADGEVQEITEFGKRLEIAYWASAAPGGGAYVLGYDAEVLTGEPQYLLLGLDEEGNQAWMQWFGDDRVTAVTDYGDGGVAIATDTGDVAVYLPKVSEGSHEVTDWWLIVFGILAGIIAFILIKRQM